MSRSSSSILECSFRVENAIFTGARFQLNSDGSIQVGHATLQWRLETARLASQSAINMGNLIGRVAIPGLYCLFNRIADKHKFIKDETDVPLSEIFEAEA